MRVALRVGLATLLLLGAWTAIVFFGTLEGWWKKPLARRDDMAGFMEAATAFVNKSNHGNAVFALLARGAVIGHHAVSVGEPVDMNTLFQVASLSKWISAWGVMALVEDGKLNLDAPVSTYLRRWTLPESEFNNNGVTARRLLSHTAGLSDGLGYAGFAPGTPVQSLEESLAHTADVSPGVSGVVRVGHKPGGKWDYSGGGYALLQLLVTDVSSESFETFMQRRVFQPLGMTESTYEWTPASSSRLATFYDTNSKEAIHYRFAALAPTSLYTSVADLTRFIQAQLPGKEGEPIGRGVLAPATIREMWKPHAQQFGADIWGLGTMLYASNNQGSFIVGHDGSNDPAINTAARFNPATGDGIVILETGNRRLATQLANDWVFWETGNVDFLAVTMAMPATIRLIGSGSIVILLGGLVVLWQQFLRRRRPRASPANEHS